MSSLIRRLAIRMMKRANYTREKWILGKDASGQPTIIPVPRGGEITDHDDNPIGRHWPIHIPARVQVPSKPQKKRQGAPRGRRRGKSNKSFIERRKAVRS